VTSQRAPCRPDTRHVCTDRQRVGLGLTFTIIYVNLRCGCFAKHLCCCFRRFVSLVVLRAAGCAGVGCRGRRGPWGSHTGTGTGTCCGVLRSQKQRYELITGICKSKARPHLRRSEERSKTGAALGDATGSASQLTRYQKWNRLPGYLHPEFK